MTRPSEIIPGSTKHLLISNHSAFTLASLTRLTILSWYHSLRPVRKLCEYIKRASLHSARVKLFGPFILILFIIFFTNVTQPLQKKNNVTKFKVILSGQNNLCVNYASKQQHTVTPLDTARVR